MLSCIGPIERHIIEYVKLQETTVRISRQMTHIN